MGSELAPDGSESDRLFSSSSIYCLGTVLASRFSVSSWLKISVNNLQALLLAALAASAIGAGVFLCS
jgi:hypothetical protein